MGVKVVVVGLGCWGPNLLRTFNSLDALIGAFDLDDKKLEKFSKDHTYKHVFFDTDWTKCLGKSDVSGIVVATPPDTHYNIAMKAIEAGKHVFIEKPMVLDIKQAEEILNFAKKQNKIIMVGHIFLYSPEIIKLKEIINSKDFGNTLYVYVKRLNLGKIQSPANVIEDLAPHDISILNYLLDTHCNKVQVFGKAHIIDTEDVAFINMYYGNVLCNLHLSWLDPLKVRDMVIVGTKQMAVCDSMNKVISLYNKYVDVKKVDSVSSESYANHLMSYKYGDITIPYINICEPMVVECEEFLRCIRVNEQPLSDGELGVSVVKTLSAMQKSLRGGEKWVKV